MLPHQHRVVQERDDLAVKIEALGTFIDNQNPVFKNLDIEDQFLLKQQLTIMVEYHRVLDARINRF
ncbi:hypothetical protein CPT_Merlin302 [Citrobacter phage Merlin]|uniref:Uncharacterized protein n=1 Tax=Citrobacter phage Merlin TaxID=1675602 RepID=A0A0K1LP41_9CAUD|nr:hypothetical protein CPT_Merlin302 [Citrobacter phage Merlin]AKU43948.1 hypothetical protein CPT_Merlin302 [Citrobacter phage Merlin]